MGGLVFEVEFSIVGRVGLPHFPDDFQPSLAEATQGLGMALTFFVQRGFCIVTAEPDSCRRTTGRRAGTTALHELVGLEGERAREPRTEGCTNRNPLTIWWAAPKRRLSPLHSVPRLHWEDLDCIVPA